MKPVVFVTYTQTIQQKVPHTLLPFPSLFLILLGQYVSHKWEIGGKPFVFETLLHK